jgi:hypothetical protein
VGLETLSRAVIRLDKLSVAPTWRVAGGGGGRAGLPAPRRGGAPRAPTTTMPGANDQQRDHPRAAEGAAPDPLTSLVDLLVASAGLPAA